MARIVSSRNRADCTVMDSLVHNTGRGSSNLGSGCFTNEEGRSELGDDFITAADWSLINRMTAEYFSHQNRGVANDSPNKKYTPSPE